jgi:prepilin-type N-terminal cleavage/methylation domain-containing protein
MSKRTTRGFTIVEVIVVVIVIGILVAVGIAVSNQIQANARNTERAADVALLANALEQYYRDNKVYPSCANMTQSGSVVASNVLKGLDRGALVAPSAPSGTDNSISCTALSEGAGPDNYAYVGNSGTDCSTGNFCYQYTLQYRQEGTGSIVSRRSIQCGQYYYSTCTW